MRMKPEIVMVDVYNDKDVIRLFRPAPGLTKALNRWRKLDSVGEAGLPFEDFMAQAGHRPLRTLTVDL